MDAIPVVATPSRTYRRFNKPSYGPYGDSLLDIDPVAAVTTEGLRLDTRSTRRESGTPVWEAPGPWVGLFHKE